jgi:D-alanyl-D-alanine carboxypeptidase
MKNLIMPFLFSLICTLAQGQQNLKINSQDAILNVNVYNPNAGETIILLHGGPGTPIGMKDLGSFFMSKFKVITFDQRGTALSPCQNGDYSMQAYIDDINSIAKHFNLKAFHLLGHSWGGVYAQIYAQRHPEKIQSLYLCSPGSGTGKAWKQTEQEVMQFNKSVTTKGEWLKMGWNSLWGTLGSDNAYQNLFSQVLKNYHVGHNSNAVSEEADFFKITSDPINKTRKNIIQYPELKKMAKIGFPILITYGDADIYGKSKELTISRYPEATTLFIPSAGHLTWVQNPSGFKNVIDRFYNGEALESIDTTFIKKTDELKQFQEKQKAPGMQYQIMKEDHQLFEYTGGIRSFEAHQPVTSETTFNMFSATKTFTAVAILQLKEKGLITLEDKVDKFLPEFQGLKEISIKDLLCHQSGLKNPIPLKWIHLEAEEETFDYDNWSNQLLQKNQTPKDNPGVVFRYSNIGYLILGKVIESVTGSSYEQYIKQEIISKVPGVDYLDYIIPESGYATGYQQRNFMAFILGLMMDKQKYLHKSNKQYLAFNPFYLNGRAYGGLISNSSSINSFLQYLLKDNTSLLSQASKNDLFQNLETHDGKPTGMGLGWFSGQLNGQRYYCHAGGGGGYYCEIRIYPDLKISSVLMMNRSGMKDKRLLDQLDTRYIP